MKKAKFSGSMIAVSVALFSAVVIFNVPVFCAVRPEPYVNRTHGFSINPPSGWTEQQSGKGGPTAIFAGPLEEGGSRAGISIYVKPTSATLDQEVAGSKSVLPPLFLNFTLVSEGNKNVGELNGYELVYTVMQPKEYGGFIEYKAKEVLLVERGMLYTIRFGQLTAIYDKYLPVFEESLQTFQLLSPEFPFEALLILMAAIAVVVVIGTAIFFMRRKARVERSFDRENIGRVQA